MVDLVFLLAIAIFLPGSSILRKDRVAKRRNVELA